MNDRLPRAAIHRRVADYEVLLEKARRVMNGERGPNCGGPTAIEANLNEAEFVHFEPDSCDHRWGVNEFSWGVTGDRAPGRPPRPRPWLGLS